MKTDEKKKPLLQSNMQSGGNRIDLPALRSLAINYPHEFMRRTQRVIDDEGMRWNDVRDLRAFFNAFCDVPVDVQVEVHGQLRTISSAAFSVLAGNLTVAGINDSYQAVATVGQDLVTDFDSMKETATIVGLLAEVHSNLDRKEGEAYPLVGVGEERFDIGSRPKGLRMQITQEMIDRNDRENVLQRVNYLGEVPAEEIEEQTLKRVYDYDGSAATPAEPYTLHRNKAGASLYVAVNTSLTRLPSTGNSISNNALVDASDLENARARLAAMTNSRGKRIAIPISECQLLVPDALAPTAQTILNSQLTPGVANENNPWGPQGSYRPQLRSTPKIDAFTTTCWLLGAFKRQFRRKWSIKMEMVTMSGDLTNYLRQRIAFEARVAWDCEVGATDYVYVIRNLTGSTAPKDA